MDITDEAGMHGIGTGGLQCIGQSHIVACLVGEAEAGVQVGDNIVAAVPCGDGDHQILGVHGGGDLAMAQLCLQGHRLCVDDNVLCKALRIRQTVIKICAAIPGFQSLKGFQIHRGAVPADSDVIFRVAIAGKGVSALDVHDGIASDVQISVAHIHSVAPVAAGNCHDVMDTTVEVHFGALKHHDAAVLCGAVRQNVQSAAVNFCAAAADPHTNLVGIDVHSHAVLHLEEADLVLILPLVQANRAVQVQHAGIEQHLAADGNGRLLTIAVDSHFAAHLMEAATIVSDAIYTTVADPVLKDCVNGDLCIAADGKISMQSDGSFLSNDLGESVRHIEVPMCAAFHTCCIVNIHKRIIHIQLTAGECSLAVHLNMAVGQVHQAAGHLEAAIHDQKGILGFQSGAVPLDGRAVPFLRPGIEEALAALDTDGAAVKVGSGAAKNIHKGDAVAVLQLVGQLVLPVDGAAAEVQAGICHHKGRAQHIAVNVDGAAADLQIGAALNGDGILAAVGILIVNGDVQFAAVDHQPAAVENTHRRIEHPAVFPALAGIINVDSTAVQVEGPAFPHLQAVQVHSGVVLYSNLTEVCQAPEAAAGKVTGIVHPESGDLHGQGRIVFDAQVGGIAALQCVHPGGTAVLPPVLARHLEGDLGRTGDGQAGFIHIGCILLIPPAVLVAVVDIQGAVAGHGHIQLSAQADGSAIFADDPVAALQLDGQVGILKIPALIAIAIVILPPPVVVDVQRIQIGVVQGQSVAIIVIADACRQLCIIVIPAVFFLDIDALEPLVMAGVIPVVHTIDGEQRAMLTHFPDPGNAVQTTVPAVAVFQLHLHIEPHIAVQIAGDHIGQLDLPGVLLAADLGPGGCILQQVLTLPDIHFNDILDGHILGDHQIEGILAPRFIGKVGQEGLVAFLSGGIEAHILVARDVHGEAQAIPVDIQLGIPLGLIGCPQHGKLIPVRLAGHRLAPAFVFKAGNGQALVPGHFHGIDDIALPAGLFRIPVGMEEDDLIAMAGNHPLSSLTVVTKAIDGVEGKVAVPANGEDKDVVGLVGIVLPGDGTNDLCSHVQLSALFHIDGTAAHLQIVIHHQLAAIFHHDQAIGPDAGGALDDQLTAGRNNDLTKVHDPEGSLHIIALPDTQIDLQNAAVDIGVQHGFTLMEPAAGVFTDVFQHFHQISVAHSGFVNAAFAGDAVPAGGAGDLAAVEQGRPLIQHDLAVVFQCCTGLQAQLRLLAQDQLAVVCQREAIGNRDAGGEIDVAVADQDQGHILGDGDIPVQLKGIVHHIDFGMAIVGIGRLVQGPFQLFGVVSPVNGHHIAVVDVVNMSFPVDDDRHRLGIYVKGRAGAFLVTILSTLTQEAALIHGDAAVAGFGGNRHSTMTAHSQLTGHVHKAAPAVTGGKDIHGAIDVHHTAGISRFAGNIHKAALDVHLAADIQNTGIAVYAIVLPIAYMQVSVHIQDALNPHIALIIDEQAARNIQNTIDIDGGPVQAHITVQGQHLAGRDGDLHTAAGEQMEVLRHVQLAIQHSIIR